MGRIDIIKGHGTDKIHFFADDYVFQAVAVEKGVSADALCVYLGLCQLGAVGKRFSADFFHVGREYGRRQPFVTGESVVFHCGDVLRDHQVGHDLLVICAVVHVEA